MMMFFTTYGTIRPVRGSGCRGESKYSSSRSARRPIAAAHNNKAPLKMIFRSFLIEGTWLNLCYLAGLMMLNGTTQVFVTLAETDAPRAGPKVKPTPETCPLALARRMG